MTRIGGGPTLALLRALHYLSAVGAFPHLRVLAAEAVPTTCRNLAETPSMFRFASSAG